MDFHDVTATEQAEERDICIKAFQKEIITVGFEMFKWCKLAGEAKNEKGRLRYWKPLKSTKGLIQL